MINEAIPTTTTYRLRVTPVTAPVSSYDALDGWVVWARQRVIGLNPDPVAALMLALIFEVRRLKGRP